ncbi:iron-containing alcohol dehydrogenase [Salmonella enterica]|nr:iron-containing alcohol dehydrogenase [Salmonella enterica]
MSTAINSVEMSLSADEIRERVRAAGVALKEGRSNFSARIPAMVQAALADVTLRTNPRPASAEEIRELLEELL